MWVVWHKKEKEVEEMSDCHIFTTPPVLSFYLSSEEQTK